MTPEERLRDLRDAGRWNGDAARPARRRPGSDRARAAVVTAVVLVLILAAIGALSRIPHASPPASPSDSPSPTAAANAVLPWDPSLVRSQQDYPERGNATGPAVPACRSAQLTVWAQSSGGGAGGTFYQGVFVQNTGALCTLVGARISLLVGGTTTAALATSVGNGSRILPTAATERLQASHVEDCITGDQTFRTLPEEELRLRIGDVVRSLHARMAFAEPCALSFTTWGMTQPDQNGVREPGFSSDLRISVPDIPDAYRGTAFDYSVTVTNTSSRAVTLRPGTVFRQLVFNSKVASLTTATLDVGAGRTIAAGASLRFRMHVPAPGDPGPDYWIAWYLDDGAGGVAAQV